MNPQPSIDPCLDGIRAHACIKHIPLWPDNGPQMMAMRQEFQLNGCKTPVHLTAKHEIVDADSRERWRAARMLQLKSIPIVIENEASAWLTSLQIIFHRRHLTKSALAYLTYPSLKPAMEEAKAIRYAYLQNAGKSVSELSSLTGIPKNIEEMAAFCGINRHFIFDAKKVHEIFAHDPAYKAQMEPRLLAEPIGGEHEQHRPVGLGAIIAGYAGKQNEDKPRQDRGQLELFSQGLKAFCLRAPLPAHEAQARKVIEEQLEKLSPEELENVERTAALIVRTAKTLGKGSSK